MSKSRFHPSSLYMTVLTKINVKLLTLKKNRDLFFIILLIISNLLIEGTRIEKMLQFLFYRFESSFIFLSDKLEVVFNPI